MPKERSDCSKWHPRIVTAYHHVADGDPIHATTRPRLEGDIKGGLREWGPPFLGIFIKRLTTLVSD